MLPQEQPKQVVVETEGPPRDNSSRRYFLASLASALFFLAGSVLYLVLAVAGVKYEKKASPLPDELLEADDDYTFYESAYDYGWTDDFVMQGVTKRDVWVTYYQVIYFAAALAFVFTGMIDIFYKGFLFGATMLLAGVFGLVSAMYIEVDEDLSDIFNLVSVHLFALEAVQLLLYRQSYPGLNFWLRLGDISFFVASTMDVALSYAYVANTGSLVELAKLQIFMALLWFPAALVYVYAVIYIHRQHGFEENKNHRRYNTVAYASGRQETMDSEDDGEEQAVVGFDNVSECNA